jgi:DNA-binding transcriptional MocR family regulator
MNNLLFVQIAAKIESLITDGTYQPGDKLPSLREIQHLHGVSVGTALQSYIYLCDKGLIVAREKSGYFVTRKSATPLDIPMSVALIVDRRKVNINATLQRSRHETKHKDFVSFFSAAPGVDMLPFNSIKRSLQNVSRNLQGDYMLYESPIGNKKLRDLIAQRSFHWNGNITSDDIVITNGALEGIHLCLRAIAKPGDTILIQTPCYYGILQCIEQLGLNIVEIPSDSSEGIDVNQLEMVCAKIKVVACLFVSNFNNPNGVKFSEEKKKAIALFANKTKTPVIEDDIYGDLYFGNKRPGNIKTYDSNGWVLLCTSFSKTLAPGYRIGWCAPGRFLKQVQKMKVATNIATSSLVQHCLLELLSKGAYDRHLRKMRLSVQRQMLHVTQAIKDFFPRHTKISRPEGGFVLWVQLPKKVNAFKLQKEALEHNIDVAPGPLFSYKSDYKNYIRISCNNIWSKKVDKALRKLGAIAIALNH